MSEPRKRKPKPFILETETMISEVGNGKLQAVWKPVMGLENKPMPFESTADAIKHAQALTGKFRVIQVCDEFTVSVKTVEKKIVTR